MLEHLAKCLAVFGLAMVRPTFAPALALVSKLHVAESILLTSLGITSSVVLVSSVGERVVAFFAARRARKGKPPKPPREIHPRVRGIWERYGALGIAFITPPLLSPPGTGMAAAAFDVPSPRVAGYMIWAGIFWGSTYSIIWYFLAESLGLARP